MAVGMTEHCLRVDDGVVAPRWIASLAVIALPLGMVVLPSPASAASDPVKPAPVESAARPDVARGVVVRALGAPGVAGARAATEAMGATMGVDVAATRAVTAGASLFLFDDLVPADEARAVAARLAARPDVLWAEADVRVYPTATPYIPNDPYFPQMTDLWNGGGAEDYSVKAPLVWSEQRGSSSVVVAILDTGVTSHPDLNANVVPGYDFVSDVAVANDGDARDPDPSDPGDWITPAEASYGEFQGCEVSDSSWHGTHVAGTVAAVQGNALGVTGIAPEARIQSVRVMGKCGGYTSDIAAGITWASGGSVPGVPANPTPAKVLNMSLGGSGTCSAGSLYGTSIAGAIARGSTVVVAAGNENESLVNHPPANCAGVIAVTATDSRGQRSAYSNYGDYPGQATIAAPGGDFEVDSGILSTVNAGTTSPVPAGATGVYGTSQGTSMAAPHVAGAAALVVSSGISDPSQVRAALVAAVQPFPAYGNRWDCTVTLCGAGILDLSRLEVGPAVTVPGAPTGLTARASATTRATLQWSAPADDGGAAITRYRLEYSRDSGATYSSLGDTAGASRTSEVVDLTPGATYQFRVAAVNSVGVGAFSQPSAPLVMPTEVVTTPGKVGGFSKSAFTKTAKTYRVTVRWKAPVDDGGSAVIGYVARFGTGGRWNPWTDLSGTSGRISGMRTGTKYTVQVRAVNVKGPGSIASYSFATPRR